MKLKGFWTTTKKNGLQIEKEAHRMGEKFLPAIYQTRD
jgi:hypothetical protein